MTKAHPLPPHSPFPSQSGKEEESRLNCGDKEAGEKSVSKSRDVVASGNKSSDERWGSYSKEVEGSKDEATSDSLPLDIPPPP